MNLDKQIAEKLPPADLEAERALLGAFFVAPEFPDLTDLDPEAVRDALSPASFSVPQHQGAFSAGKSSRLDHSHQEPS